MPPNAAKLPNPWTVPVITVPIAGFLLGMNHRQAYVAAARGELPTITLAGVKHVPVAELYALLALPLPPRPPGPPIVDR
jgi:hypothetical protein